MRAELRAQILEMMPASCREIRKEVGFTHDQTWKRIEQLREDGRCYVLRWDGNEAIYAAGRGKDAERPAPRGRNQKENNARAYQKRKNKAALAGPFAALFQR